LLQQPPPAAHASSVLSATESSHLPCLPQIECTMHLVYLPLLHSAQE
jgi:hypothetical protein